MIELNAILKVAPVVGGIIMVAVAFGELNGTVHALQKQVDTIEMKLDKIADAVGKK